MKSFRLIPCRVVIVSATLASLVAALGIAPWRLAAAEAKPAKVTPPAKNDPAELTPAQEKILETLKRPGRFNFIEIPLGKVADDVKDRYGIDLCYDEKAFHEKKLGSDTPVTLVIRDVNLNNALWVLFRQLGLTHVIRGDDLFITTPQEAGRIVQAGGIDPDQVKLWPGNGKVFFALSDLTVMDFIETPLQDVMDFLKDLHDVPIQLDERALHKVAARTDTPMTCSIKGVTLNSGLRLMLDEIGLTHVVTHEILLVTTPRERDRLVQHGAFEPDDIRFSPENKRILSALAEKPRIEFIDTPLQDVVDYLEDLQRTRIWFDRRAIRNAGIKLDARVTRNFEGITLHSALQELLGQLGLAHVVQHEVLLITTAEESRRRLQAGALAPTDTKPAEGTSPTNRIAAALQKPLTLECREKPFSELVDLLKQQCGVEIRIDDWGLATVGLDRDFPSTIAVKDVTLQSVFKQLLRDVELAYLVEGDLVVITGRDSGLYRRERPLGDAERDLWRMGADLGFERSESGPPAGYVVGVSFSRHRDRVSDDVFEQLKGLNRLRHLDLARTEVSDAGLVHLTNFPQLETLDLSQTGISDAGLAHVRKLPHLTRLNLSGRTITDAGLAHVAALRELRYLKLGCQQVTDAGLEHLQGLTRLHELELDSPQITDAGLRHLADLRQLEVLAIRYTKARGAGLEHVAGLRQLRRLSLEGLDDSGVRLEPVASCTQLETLRLEGRGVTDADLAHLAPLSRLRTLDLVCPKVSDAGLKHLAGLTKLNQLKLSRTKVTDAGLAHLAGLTGLAFLDLSQTQVTGAGLSHLRAPQLEQLILRRSKVTDAGLAHLKGLTGLRRLDLSHTKMTQLEQLILGRSKVTNAGLVHLKELTGLRQLDLSHTRITDAGVVHLRQWWQNVLAASSENPFARVLSGRLTGRVDVHGTRLTPAAVAELMRELPGLQVTGK